MRRYDLMKNFCSALTLLLLAVSFAVLPSCRQPDVSIHSFSPLNGQDENSGVTNTAPIQPTLPATTTATGEEYIERNIIVDDKNNVFSIGMPAGYQERTEVSAQKPIDYWFEYLPVEVKLEVDGIEIQRTSSWEMKIKHTRSVTNFRYVITNTTGSAISYNLHLVPSAAGTSVPVIVRQRWIP